MKEKPDDVVYFLKTGIWLVPEGNLSWIKRFFLRFLKVLLLAIRGYEKNSLGTRASALTYYTFLSVVPIIAVAFGISKGFKLDKILQTTLLSAFSQQKDIIELVFQYADALLEKTSGGLVAGAGVAMLLWLVFNLLWSLEEAFNHVWQVSESRGISRRAADYLSFALIGPAFSIAATSATFMMKAKVEIIAFTVAKWGISPLLILVPLRFTPFILVWALFSFIFLWIPNTRVRWSAGIGAGIIAGTSYQLLQWVYITFQIGVSRNNAIYGSLAAIPLFLAWTTISWIIVLIGSEISHAIQDLDSFGFQECSEEVSLRHRKTLAILIVCEIAKRFQQETNRLTVKEIAAKLKMPYSLARNILSDLSGAGLVSAVRPDGKNKEDTWQPGKDIHNLSVASVLDVIDRSGTAEPDFQMSDEFRAVSETLEEFSRTLDASPANRRILDL